jgi:hypothetical protein
MQLPAPGHRAGGIADLWKWTIRQPSGRFAMTNVARPSEVIVFPSLVREEALKPVKSTAVSERTMDAESLNTAPRGMSLFSARSKYSRMSSVRVTTVWLLNRTTRDWHSEVLL